MGEGVVTAEIRQKFSRQENDMDLQIQVNGLAFRYGASPVLQDIHLSLEKGEFTCIIGPNGSGKSTLLKNLAAVLDPAEGDIILDGKELRRWTRRELAHRLSLVSQGRGAGFNFVVEDVVAMGRYPYLERFSPMREADHRAVNRAMHLTGCYHLREREIFALSGGEQQRVILARALAQETPYLLLDEPTSFLDLGYQVELLELLQSLNTRERITIIMVMHDLNLASRYCRKMIMLYQGKIYACGSPAEVLTRKNILEVYRTEVLIEPHPLGGNPQIIPISTSSPAINHNGSLRRVHIIGGGGSATPLINELFVKGFPLSAGVLSVGDSDWATARRLGLTMVEEAPFSPISEERHRDNLDLIDMSGAVILAPLYMGPGNLLNVEAACYALKQGLPVFMINEPPAGQRDFAGGKALDICRRLLNGGAVPLSRLDDRLTASLNTALDLSSPRP
jgi:iron complex transport system ATP-binding protein